MKEYLTTLEIPAKLIEKDNGDFILQFADLSKSKSIDVSIKDTTLN